MMRDIVITLNMRLASYFFLGSFIVVNRLFISFIYNKLQQRSKSRLLGAATPKTGLLERFINCVNRSRRDKEKLEENDHLFTASESREPGKKCAREQPLSLQRW